MELAELQQFVTLNPLTYPLSCYIERVDTSPPTVMATTMQFTPTELEFLSSFLTFSYIRSIEGCTETDDQLLDLVARFKAEETKLINH